MHHQFPVPLKSNSPTLLLPKKRPDLVEEDGGGGFWICEAVGARDCLIEYVLCMMGDCVDDQSNWRLWMTAVLLRMRLVSKVRAIGYKEGYVGAVGLELRRRPVTS